MEQLAENFEFSFEVKPGKGVYTTVVRKSDGATRVFFNAGHETDDRLKSFMFSMTDELCESYFPKPRKTK